MEGLQNLQLSPWQFERTNSAHLLLTDGKLIGLFRNIVGLEVPNFHVEFFWPVDVQQLQHTFDGKFLCSFEVKEKMVPPDMFRPIR
jgi:hypothetical protein